MYYSIIGLLEHGGEEGMAIALSSTLLKIKAKQTSTNTLFRSQIPAYLFIPFKEIIYVDGYRVRYIAQQYNGQTLNEREQYLHVRNNEQNVSLTTLFCMAGIMS